MTSGALIVGSSKYASSSTAHAEVAREEQTTR
jgi:hypothetical protein